MSLDKTKSFCLSVVLSQMLPSEIENIRLYDILYLADWHYAIYAGKGRTITDAVWRRGHLGPYSPELAKAISQYRGTKNTDDVLKARILESVELRVEEMTAFCDTCFSQDELDSLEHVIQVVKTGDENLCAITKLVYGTMPLMDADMDSVLDISDTAIRHAKIYGYYDDTWAMSEMKPEGQAPTILRRSYYMEPSAATFMRRLKSGKCLCSVMANEEDALKPEDTPEVFETVFENYKARTSRADNYTYLTNRQIITSNGESK